MGDLTGFSLSEYHSGLVENRIIPPYSSVIHTPLQLWARPQDLVSFQYYLPVRLSHCFCGTYFVKPD